MTATCEIHLSPDQPAPSARRGPGQRAGQRARRQHPGYSDIIPGATRLRRKLPRSATQAMSRGDSTRPRQHDVQRGLETAEASVNALRVGPGIDAVPAGWNGAVPHS